MASRYFKGPELLVDYRMYDYQSAVAVVSGRRLQPVAWQKELSRSVVLHCSALALSGLLVTRMHARWNGVLRSARTRAQAHWLWSCAPTKFHFPKQKSVEIRKIRDFQTSITLRLLGVR